MKFTSDITLESSSNQVSVCSAGGISGVVIMAGQVLTIGKQLDKILVAEPLVSLFYGRAMPFLLHRRSAKLLNGVCLKDDDKSMDLLKLLQSLSLSLEDLEVGWFCAWDHHGRQEM